MIIPLLEYICGEQAPFITHVVVLHMYQPMSRKAGNVRKHGLVR